MTIDVGTHGVSRDFAEASMRAVVTRLREVYRGGDEHPASPCTDPANAQVQVVRVRLDRWKAALSLPDGLWPIVYVVAGTGVEELVAALRPGSISAYAVATFTSPVDVTIPAFTVADNGAIVIEDVVLVANVPKAIRVQRGSTTSLNIGDALSFAGVPALISAVAVDDPNDAYPNATLAFTTPPASLFADIVAELYPPERRGYPPGGYRQLGKTPPAPLYQWTLIFTETV